MSNHDTDTADHPVISEISKEIEFLSLDNFALVNTLQFNSTYTCRYMFQKVNFTQVLSGHQVLHEISADRLQFDPRGLQISAIRADDIFVRSGQLAGLVKTYLYENKNLIHKKYTDSNTYTQTLKLGFRFHPVNNVVPTDKRVSWYINLIQSLQCIQKALISNAAKQHQTDQSCYQIVDKVKRPHIRQPDTEMTATPAVSQQQKAHALHVRLEINHLTNVQGIIDHVGVESQAKEVEAKLEIVLSKLSRLSRSTNLNLEEEHSNSSDSSESLQMTKQLNEIVI